MSHGVIETAEDKRNGAPVMALTRHAEEHLGKDVDEHQDANDDCADRRHEDRTCCDVLGQLDLGSGFGVQEINHALNRRID
jgi:hypothetical protein